MKTGLITLTTDFGFRDPFVGTMKGVILGINPNARIVDLTHGIPAQDLSAAALALGASAPFFPEGTIHLSVVDPDVGSERRPLAIESAGHFFVGPDNGIFTLALKGKEIGQVVELSNDNYHMKPTSKTFHGRDIFAPVAAHLSLGTSPQELGNPVKDFKRLHWPEVIIDGTTIQGEIVYIDGFGNLITNINERNLMSIPAQHVGVSLGDLTISGLTPSYSHGQKDFIALINSWGFLEISLYKRNAQLSCGAIIGEKVYIRDRRTAP
ncbi:MAG: S-adenosyl-l-methionine hydroxide adenosyltransferase family protein [Candidatus Binatia bacterium]